MGLKNAWHSVDKDMDIMHCIQQEQKQLYTVLQPIYSFSNQACIGLEALVRGTRADQSAVPVYECLTPPENTEKKLFNRELNQMHLKNWQALSAEETWLFINLDFNGLNHFSDFCLKDLLSDLDICGKQIVVEVVESEVDDEPLFERIVSDLRAQGCLIALDDFGSAYSNVDRIWRVEPDIVKLDRQILLEATKNIRSQSILRNLTKLIQQSGSIALLEGIETEEQALLAMEVGVDLVQGFYFAMPEKDLTHVLNGAQKVTKITEMYPSYMREKQFLKSIQKSGYESLFEGLKTVNSVIEAEAFMVRLSRMSFVKRYFLLDEKGYQVSNDVPLEDAADASRKVLKKSKGLCWKNRRYFQRAMEGIGGLYISEPYRSLIDVELCLTVSKAVDISGKVYVACYDVYYHDKSAESVQIST